MASDKKTRKAMEKCLRTGFESLTKDEWKLIRAYGKEVARKRAKTKRAPKRKP